MARQKILYASTSCDCGCGHGWSTANPPEWRQTMAEYTPIITAILASGNVLTEEHPLVRTMVDEIVAAHGCPRLNVMVCCANHLEVAEVETPYEIETINGREYVT